MVNFQPNYPENIKTALQELQSYYNTAVENRELLSFYDKPDKQIANLHLQLAQLAAIDPPVGYKDAEIDPTDPYALKIAHLMLEIIRLANARNHKVNLAAALQHHETQATETYKQEDQATQRVQRSEDLITKPRLYGKAGMAAEGDWYGSH